MRIELKDKSRKVLFEFFKHKNSTKIMSKNFDRNNFWVSYYYDELVPMPYHFILNPSRLKKSISSKGEINFKDIYEN